MPTYDLVFAFQSGGMLSWKILHTEEMHLAFSQSQNMSLCLKTVFALRAQIYFSCQNLPSLSTDATAFHHTAFAGSNIAHIKGSHAVVLRSPSGDGRFSPPGATAGPSPVEPMDEATFLRAFQIPLNVPSWATGALPCLTIPHTPKPSFSI